VRYRLVSLFALQLTPTLIVFGAMLPVYSLTRSPGRGPGLLDGLAALVAGGALILETAADEQKRRRKAVCAPGEFVAAGLWSRCRHPNYLGEVGFWWGVFFFALGAGWAQSWTAVGAAAMTLLFRLVSVPLMDRRLAGRYPGYAAWARRVPALLPGRRRT
jgi:steroid 5-alpha reductase family enzyme